MEREVGGGIGMGNTCKSMAVSFKCMTKSTTNKKKKFFFKFKKIKKSSKIYLPYYPFISHSFKLATFLKINFYLSIVVFCHLGRRGFLPVQGMKMWVQSLGQEDSLE